MNVIKLAIIALILLCREVSIPGNAQTITYSGKSIKVKKVFAAIKKQTGYVFFYDESVLADFKPVTLAVKNVHVNEVMDLLLKGKRLVYSIENKTIFIRRRPENEFHQSDSI